MTRTVRRSKRRAKRSTWPKCPTCQRKLGILHFPNTETCYVFCCGCNYRQESPEMWTYVDRTLFRGLHDSQEKRST